MVSESPPSKKNLAELTEWNKTINIQMIHCRNSPVWRNVLNLKHTRLRPLWGTLVDRMKPLAQAWRVTQTAGPSQGKDSGSRMGGRYMLMLCGVDKIIWNKNPSDLTFWRFSYSMFASGIQEGVQFIAAAQLLLLRDEARGLSGQDDLVALGSASVASVAAEDGALEGRLVAHPPEGSSLGQIVCHITYIVQVANVSLHQGTADHKKANNGRSTGRHD